ncbi:MAG: hypothetical protein ACI4MN_03040 [Candidatus Coproplasma sp.]
MKNLKKSWIALLLCLVAAAFGVYFVGCSKKDGYANTEVSATDKVVAITIVEASQNTSLLNAMECAQDEEKLTFTISDGMVTSINGTANANNCYWMLYTSDAENANTAWGTYVYEGQEFGSSVLGAESLTVKVGCIYVWVYTQF